MSQRPSNGSATPLFDLTGGASDSSSDGEYGPPPTLPTLKPRRTPGSPEQAQYESEDEDYINGILLAPAAGAKDDESDSESDIQIVMSKQPTQRRRVLDHRDEDFGPAAEGGRSQSSTPTWDKTGPSLHHDAAEWRLQGKSNSGTPPWDRTGPSLHHSSSKGLVQPKSEAPPWDRTGPSLHHSTGRRWAQPKSETPSWDRTGPSLLRSAAKAKGKGKAVDDGIDWGNDRLAVVIDTPKSWFERQAQARKAAGVKVATEGSARRKPAPRRIVEVVIPVPR